MISISYNQIKYVIALEKCGSFSIAADKCFVTQSTLSTMIKKLEDQLELKLFDRSYKPIVLTPEGQKLIDQFRVLENEYDRLVDLGEQTRVGFYGNLKIGIIPTLAPFLLPLFLDRISIKYPDLNLEINETTTYEIISKLELREIDIGILSIPLEEPEMIQESLFKEEFMVYDTRKNTTKSKAYKINDIDISKLWLLEESHCLTSQIGKICQLKNEWKSESNLKLMTGSIFSLLELVKLKNGITLLPKLATFNKGVVDPKNIYRLEKPVPVRDIGLVTTSSFVKKDSYDLLKKEIIKSVSPHLRKEKSSIDIPPF